MGSLSSPFLILPIKQEKESRVDTACLRAIVLDFPAIQNMLPLHMVTSPQMPPP